MMKAVEKLYNQTSSQPEIDCKMLSKNQQTYMNQWLQEIKY